MQLQLLNCITSAGPKPTLENSSGTKRYYIDLQSNIIGHQLNYYWSDKVLDISYLYYRGLGRLNVNLLNACICFSSERLSALIVFRSFERPGYLPQVPCLPSHLLVQRVKIYQTNCSPRPNHLWPLLVSKKQTRIINFNWFHSRGCFILKQWWFNWNEWNHWHLALFGISDGSTATSHQ